MIAKGISIGEPTIDFAMVSLPSVFVLGFTDKDAMLETEPISLIAKCLIL